MVYPHFSGSVRPRSPWGAKSVPPVYPRTAWPFQSSVPAKPYEGPVRVHAPRKGG